ncbi:hypothetical protein LTR24_007584 [Lithohypha guttulata]|uniref:CFEM domain-containing protein n=1 Tax=Lithohypha guttulata TaxID=1690604 RepID=A0ABR0K326_9EURO|nr:hypothetical protein LTR24_007584 [Lithohypha guttulata]
MYKSIVLAISAIAGLVCAQSIPTSNCNGSPECICNDAEWIASVSCCVKTNCNEADQQAALSYANLICTPVGASLPTTASCANNGAAAASGSASSSASSATRGAASSVSSAQSSVSSSASSMASSISSAASSAAGSASSAASSAAAGASSAALGNPMAVPAAGGILGAIFGAVALL